MAPNATGRNLARATKMAVMEWTVFALLGLTKIVLVPRFHVAHDYGQWLGMR